jgi:hypothetical protein
MPESKSLTEKLSEASPYIAAAVALFAAIAKATGEPVEVVAQRVADYVAKVQRGEVEDSTDALLAAIERDLEA